MGHVVPKSGISLTKVGQNIFWDIKLTEQCYCALLYSTVACLALLKSSSGVCKLKQFELQFRTERAHTVGSKLRG